MLLRSVADSFGVLRTLTDTRVSLRIRAALSVNGPYKTLARTQVVVSHRLAEY